MTDSGGNVPGGPSGMQPEGQGWQQNPLPHNPVPQNPMHQNPMPQNPVVPAAIPPTNMPGSIPKAKKKKWPWIVGGLGVLAVLAGGCGVAIFSLVGAVGDVQDEIEAVTVEMFTEASAGDFAAAAAVADGGGECVTTDKLESALQQTEPSAWDISEIKFVQRNGNSTLSNVTDAEKEGFYIDQRSDESAASVAGTLTTAAGPKDFTLFLTKPSGAWRVCGIEVN